LLFAPSHSPRYRFHLPDIHPADLLFIRDNKTNSDVILDNINSANNELKQAIITLLFALTAGYSEVAKLAKE
jgi:hypothetical protein